MVSDRLKLSGVVGASEVELSALGVGATVFARLVESFTLPSYEQRRFGPLLFP
jgi:hypothetical protein